MNNFIEIHINGEQCLINCNRIEEIKKYEDNLCKICFASEGLRYIRPDETYDQIKNMIWR